MSLKTATLLIYCVTFSIKEFTVFPCIAYQLKVAILEAFIITGIWYLPRYSGLYQQCQYTTKIEKLCRLAYSQPPFTYIVRHLGEKIAVINNEGNRNVNVLYKNFCIKCCLGTMNVYCLLPLPLQSIWVKRRLNAEFQIVTVVNAGNSKITESKVNQWGITQTGSYICVYPLQKKDIVLIIDHLYEDMIPL